MSMGIKVSYLILNELSLRNERTVDFLVLCRQYGVTTLMKEVLLKLYKKTLRKNTQSKIM